MFVQEFPSEIISLLIVLCKLLSETLTYMIEKEYKLTFGNVDFPRILPSDMTKGTV